VGVRDPDRDAVGVVSRDLRCSPAVHRRVVGLADPAAHTGTVLLSATTRPRCVDFDGAHNFRDLGGYRSRLGGTTRWGRLYRAGSLDRMTAADIDRYRSLGIAVAIDLRNEDERRRVPDPVDSLHVPIMNRLMQVRERPDFGALVERDHGVAFMRDMNLGLLEHAGDEIGRVVAIIADRAPDPVMFHCTAGKDRTGLISALLLEVLGVERADVIEDFRLSERYSGRMEESHGFVRMIEYGVAPEAAAGAFGAPPEMLAGVLDELDVRYGGAEQYLRRHARVSDERITSLRHTLLT
jgi:protein-tyrosine phosphatase